jgi:dephospho-CoA kinase
MQDLFDVVVVAWVPPEVQKQRLLSRDSLTIPRIADAILNSQISIDDKRKKADLVFENTLPPGKQLEDRLNILWKSLVKEN